MHSLAFCLRHASFQFAKDYWAGRIRDEYGLPCIVKDDVHSAKNILRRTYLILKMMPPALVKACEINSLIIRNDMGKSRPFFPNHGAYREGDKTITLNADIFYSEDVPEDFVDEHGYFVGRTIQTLAHEMGHAFDHAMNDLSTKKEWTDLSGWSETPKPGLRQLTIREPGCPVEKGEWFYRPDASFTRFYAKKTPWDDFADSFSFYVTDLRGKVPASKREYFDTLLKRYYE